MTEPAPNHTAQKLDLIEAIMADAVLSAAAKCVATVLLIKFRNGRTGRCNPSFEAIAEAVGRQRRATVYAVQELVAAGWITVQGTRGGGRGNTNSFGFAFDRAGPQASQRVQSTAPFDAKGCNLTSERVQHTAHEPGRTLSSLREEEGGSACARAPDGAALVLVENFLAFWTVHPNAINQKATRSEFEKITASGEATAADIVAGARRYATARDGQNPNRTLGSLRWLQEARWTDRPAVTNGRGHGGGVGRQKPSLARLALIHGGIVDGGAA